MGRCRSWLAKIIVWTERPYSSTVKAIKYDCSTHPPAGFDFEKRTIVEYVDFISERQHKILCCCLRLIFKCRKKREIQRLGLTRQMTRKCVNNDLFTPKCFRAAIDKCRRYPSKIKRHFRPSVVSGLMWSTNLSAHDMKFELFTPPKAVCMANFALGGRLQKINLVYMTLVVITLRYGIWFLNMNRGGPQSPKSDTTSITVTL